MRQAVLAHGKDEVGLEEVLSADLYRRTMRHDVGPVGGVFLGRGDEAGVLGVFVRDEIKTTFAEIGVVFVRLLTR